MQPSFAKFTYDRGATLSPSVTRGRRPSPVASNSNLCFSPSCFPSQEKQATARDRSRSRRRRRDRSRSRRKLDAGQDSDKAQLMHVQPSFAKFTYDRGATLSPSVTRGRRPSPVASNSNLCFFPSCFPSQDEQAVSASRDNAAQDSDKAQLTHRTEEFVFGDQVAFMQLSFVRTFAQALRAVRPCRRHLLMRLCSVDFLRRTMGRKS